MIAHRPIDSKVTLRQRNPGGTRGRKVRGGDPEPTGTRQGLRLSPLEFFTEGGFGSAGAGPEAFYFLVLGRGWHLPRPGDL
ncbi:unnamed protein product [Leuciscus chuanchicus]